MPSNSPAPDPAESPESAFSPVSQREIFSWAMFDFANSSYLTVVVTTIFNTYFVNVIAGLHKAGNAGLPTLLWTCAIGLSNFLVVVSAPVLGAFADHSANKKLLLAGSTVICAACTALLALTHSGTVALAISLIVLANFAYGTGENLIAAFLTEIASKDNIGKISALGLALGYFGGPATLLVCLAYIHFAARQGLGQSHFVPICMLMVAIIYALGTLPMFFWLRERRTRDSSAGKIDFIRIGFRRLSHTVKHARSFSDLFRFLTTLLVFSCGTSTVIALAAIYAQQVMGFNSQETIGMILVVNVTAAAGAFAFGHVQDKAGSVKTLKITLALWAVAIVLAFFITNKIQFWADAILIGCAMGSTQSTARALVGQFSPLKRSAEFFGLWGLAVKLASIIGPITFGWIGFVTNGNQRLAILSTAAFFVAGFALMNTVDEERGKSAALLSD